MNQKIKKILACVDFSEYSRTVMDHALEMAKGPDAEILVLNVINQRDVNGAEQVFSYYPGSFSTIINTKDYIRDMKKERQEKLKQMIKDLYFENKSRMTVKVDVGIPYECILEAIDAENIDVVVMANKGRGNLSRVLFGSAAEKVFRHSPVPVLSVRERKLFKRESAK